MFNEQLGCLLDSSEAGIERDSSLRHLTSDLVSTNGIAGRATLANQRKLGESLL
jgi:hypothetical protein